MGCSGFDGGSDAISDVAHCCRASRPAWVAESGVSRRKGLVVRYRRRWAGRVRWFRDRGGGCVHEARGTGRASRAAGPWRARPGIPASQQPSSPYSLAPQGKLGPIGAPALGPCGHFAASPSPLMHRAAWTFQWSQGSLRHRLPQCWNLPASCRLQRREYRCWGLSPDIPHCRKPSITPVFPEQWLKPQSALPGQPPRAPRQRAWTRRTSSRAPYHNGEVRLPSP